MSGLGVGIIGGGNISEAYLRLAPLFRGVTVVAVADMNLETANARAEQFGIRAHSVNDLLGSDDIDVVVNLTIPDAHFDVSRQVLEANKHVYSEKPFVLTYEQGQTLNQLATQQGKRIGSAPDTFLGGAHQQARAMVDAGDIGDIVGGTCHFMNHGMENWHPNPDFFYKPGGGPMLDMGPYYISNLVQLMGPVTRVMAMSSMPFKTRTISSEPRAGETLEVTTPTSISALLEFHSGAQINLIVSWDVWEHQHNCMELYGTKATMYVPDPNFFGGEIRIANAQQETIVRPDHPFARANDENKNGQYLANYRGAGLADMVAAISENRPHRCNDKLALHVVDIMTSALRSGEEKRAIELQTTCERPAALDHAAARALLA